MGENCSKMAKLRLFSAFRFPCGDKSSVQGFQFYELKFCCFQSASSKVSSLFRMALSISIFFIFADISTIVINIRYFYDPLIDIDIDISERLTIDINIFHNCLIDIDIFHNCLIDIDIDFFQNCLKDININISKMTISISIFFKSVDISTSDIRYRYIEQGYRI